MGFLPLFGHGRLSLSVVDVEEEGERFPMFLSREGTKDIWQSLVMSLLCVLGVVLCFGYRSALWWWGRFLAFFFFWSMRAGQFVAAREIYVDDPCHRGMVRIPCSPREYLVKDVRELCDSSNNKVPADIWEHWRSAVAHPQCTVV